jgi:DNA/RNA-binding domain of Phe-tRNA-synthetase-like protein
MPEQRYTISELIEIAEQQTAEAKRALKANEPDAADRVQQWSDTLKALQIMKERGVPDSLRDIPKP